MRIDEQCKIVCRKEALAKEEAKDLKSKIEEEYRVNMCVTSVLSQSLMRD